MKKLVILLFAAMCCGGFISCNKSDDEKSSSNGLIGWYADIDNIATTSDFDRVNQAIKDHELLADYRYIDYYATRDLFFREDGSWCTTGPTGKYGVCEGIPKSKFHWISPIRIVNNNTLEYYVSANLWDPDYVPNDALIHGRVYAGEYIGDLVYYCERMESPTTHTYIREGNKIIVSNGDIYTISDDGSLIKDGTSYKLKKYTPTKK